MSVCLLFSPGCFSIRQLIDIDCDDRRLAREEDVWPEDAGESAVVVGRQAEGQGCRDRRQAEGDDAAGGVGGRRLAPEQGLPRVAVEGVDVAPVASRRREARPEEKLACQPGGGADPDDRAVDGAIPPKLTRLRCSVRVRRDDSHAHGAAHEGTQARRPAQRSALHEPLHARVRVGCFAEAVFGGLHCCAPGAADGTLPPRTLGIR